MTELALSGGAALWFGVLTSISPCLLATNVAAISFLARRVDSVRVVLLSCACYIAGQALAFILLAAVLVSSLLSVPLVSHLLQKYMFRFLGPVLIVCALFLLELITLELRGGRWKAWAQSRANAGGFSAAALLGIVFAMSFCPTTGALFFGSLLPLAITHHSTVLLPALYALGVALPVMAFSVVIALAAQRVGRVFAQVGVLEAWARRATGAIFLLLGLYFLARYTLGLW
jgi:cytochrome c-type biogenesis protein